MGKPHKRGSRWVATYERERDPITGKRRQGWVSAPTRRECEQLLTKRRREVDTGTDLDPTTMTVAEYLEHWLETDARPRVEITTYERHWRQIARNIAPHIGAVPLAKLTPLHLSRLYATLAAAGYAPSTIARAAAIVKGALKRAVLWQLVPRNVAAAAAAPAVPAHEPSIWTVEEAARFVAHLGRRRWLAPYHVAAATGLRGGEVLGLRWSDLDLAAATLAVRQSVKSTAAGLIFGPTKGKRARVVALTPDTVAALRAQRARVAAAQLAAGPGWEDHDLVFPRDNGRPIPPVVYRARFRRAVVAAGVPPARPHDLRHLHATLLLARGVHPKVVQERLGHATLAQTMDTYSHVTPSMQRGTGRFRRPPAPARVAGRGGGGGHIVRAGGSDR